MNHLLRKPAPFGLIMLLALAVTFVAGLLLAPRHADAVGGLSLMDRVMLAGTVRSYVVACNQDPGYVVPEGKRFFLVHAHTATDRDFGATISIGGVSLAHSSASRAPTSISPSLPIVYPEGAGLAVACGPNNDTFFRTAIVGYEF